jgi:hypothetical protein
LIGICFSCFFSGRGKNKAGDDCEHPCCRL